MLVKDEVCYIMYQDRPEIPPSFDQELQRIVQAIQYWDYIPKNKLGLFICKPEVGSN